MIENFDHKGLKLLFEKGDSSKINPQFLRRIENILTRLDAAKEIRDINAPSLKLHALKGDRLGYWVVSVSGNWRITFRFEDGAVFDVSLEDYH